MACVFYLCNLLRRLNTSLFSVVVILAFLSALDSISIVALTISRSFWAAAHKYLEVFLPGCPHADLLPQPDGAPGTTADSQIKPRLMTAAGAATATARRTGTLTA
jgi:hypothetical protein